VVLVTNQFPTPSEPERGIFTLQIAARLAAHCRLTVVCPLPWFPRIPALRPLRAWYRFAEVPHAWTRDGIRIVSPKYALVPKVSEGLHARLMAARLRPVLRDLVRAEGIDLVNSHWLYPDSVAVHLALGRSPVPHVPTGLGCDVNEYLDDRSKGPQIRAMLGAAPAVTVVSDGLRERLVAGGVAPERVTTIPNGIDTSAFQVRDRAEARRGLKLAANGTYVLYVGRLSEEKSPGTLVTAMAALGAAHPAAELLMVGDGPLRRVLAEQVRALGIDNRVRFVGQQGHEQVATWMAAADCLCLPSLREGSPNVVLEALGSGLPVVASSVGDVPTVVTGESGILVPPNAPAPLATALAAALDRSWDRMAIHRSVATRSWETVALAYWTTFRRVLDARAQAGPGDGRAIPGP
jgi:glycosyltransferase involved in cell wall biosynthesis